MQKLFLVASCIVLLSACSQRSAEVPSSSGTVQAPVAEAPASAPSDDGIPDEPETYASSLAGPYVLWRDIEGSTLCDVELLSTPTLGGYALEADRPCIEKLGVHGEMFAWFLDHGQGALVIVDATRRPIIRLPDMDDGTFYLARNFDHPDGIMLSPKQ